MALGDIKIVDNAGYSVIPTITWNVQAGAAATINAGTPTKASAAGGNYVIPMVDGDPINTTTLCTGIAQTTSNDTAAADGTVAAFIPLPGVVYAAKAKSSTAANTAAKVLALIGKRVYLDLTSSTWTVDTAAADNANNGLLLVGGDYNTNTVYFVIRSTFAILN